MKKIILFLVMILFFITGCGNNNKELNNAEVLAKVFKTEIKSKDIKKVAETISKDSIIETNVEVFDINEGDYLSGFTKEISGYKQAVGIRPMIGSIPFIAYIFLVDNPESFVTTLENNADLRWNVCTEADYMKTEIVDNYVFFTMIPKEF